MGALSGFDANTLWDIKGKYCGVPCCGLLEKYGINQGLLSWLRIHRRRDDPGMGECQSPRIYSSKVSTPFVDSDRREIMPLESFAAKNIGNASGHVYQYRGGGGK